MTCNRHLGGKCTPNNQIWLSSNSRSSWSWFPVDFNLISSSTKIVWDLNFQEASKNVRFLAPSDVSKIDVTPMGFFSELRCQWSPLPTHLELPSTGAWSIVKDCSWNQALNVKIFTMFASWTWRGMCVLGSVQDWSPHMSFILKGYQISAPQLTGWFKSKTPIQ
jgi:hypothetical protein